MGRFTVAKWRTNSLRIIHEVPVPGDSRVLQTSLEVPLEDGLELYDKLGQVLYPSPMKVQREDDVEPWALAYEARIHELETTVAKLERRLEGPFTLAGLSTRVETAHDRIDAFKAQLRAKEAELMGVKSGEVPPPVPFPAGASISIQRCPCGQPHGSHRWFIDGHYYRCPGWSQVTG